MGLEDLVQQWCGLHSGAAVLPADGRGSSTGEGGEVYVDAETDAMGLLRAWLGDWLGSIAREMMRDWQELQLHGTCMNDLQMQRLCLMKNCSMTKSHSRKNHWSRSLPMSGHNKPGHRV